MLTALISDFIASIAKDTSLNRPPLFDLALDFLDL